VIAIDADIVAIAEARARGVGAIRADWPRVDVPLADMVAFTRSLHHIGPLVPALDRAREVLKDEGMMLVEDFAREEPSGTVLEEFVDRVRASAWRERFERREGELVAELLATADSLDVWSDHHDRKDVHSSQSMRDAFKSRCASLRSESAPYLYRYLVRALPEQEDAATWLAEMLAWERSLNPELWIGRRFVAWNRGAYSEAGLPAPA
jgi:hypothetical protein